MQNGLYVATSGLLMQEQKLSVISNNIANVNTNGFKKEMALFSDYRPVDNRNPQNLIQQSLYNRTINSSVKLDDISTNHEPGHFQFTNNFLDLALEDKNNFFAVDTPWGVRYTKDGTFTMNENGEIVTRDGFNLLDRNTGAPITIPPGAQSVDIREDGTVMYNNGAIGQVDVARFEDLEYMQKVGRNLYTAVGILPELPDKPAIRQGFVEGSNVNPISEMVQMIEALRAFEMYQKVVHTYDSLNEQSANSIAKL